jgi:hypothetical protein
MSEAQRNALNALLYQTGEQSETFMLVLATNRPGDLDAAVQVRLKLHSALSYCSCMQDRVDESIGFSLPKAGEREVRGWLS